MRDPREAWARLRALAALAAAQRRIRRRGIAAALARRVRPARARPADPAAVEAVVARVERSLHAVAPLVPAAACLARAVAGRDLLARAGVASDLRVGVARAADGRLDAHAWLEVAGRVRVGAVRDLGRYRALPDPTAAAHLVARRGAAERT